MSNELFKGKVILITGAGSIGCEIFKQVQEYDIESVRIMDNSELKLHNLRREYQDSKKKLRYIFGDLRDIERLRIAIRGADIVFHTAAMKHVSFCEDNPIDAIKTNILGTQNIIQASIEEKVDKFINISTDKATNPINVMGATKLLTERLTSASANYKGRIDTVLTSVRFGNVFDSSGSVVPIFRNQLLNDEDITVTDRDMTRFVITKDNAIRLVFEATRLAMGEEIFVLNMPSMRIMDLAVVMSNMYNEGAKIKIIGATDGEKLHETLITEEEAKKAYTNGELIVVPPSKYVKHYHDLGFEKFKGGSVVSNQCDYMSNLDIWHLLWNGKEQD